MPAHRHGGVAEARYAFSMRPGRPIRQIIEGRCRVDDEPRPQCLDLGSRLCRRLLLAERQQCATKPVGSDLRRQKNATVPRRRAGGHPKRDDVATCRAVCQKHRRHGARRAVEFAERGLASPAYQRLRIWPARRHGIEQGRQIGGIILQCGGPGRRMLGPHRGPVAL
jgi:hypothetical protein